MKARRLVILLLLAATPARADVPAAKRQEARAHFEGGQRKFDVGKFDEAAESFVAAYEIIGDPVILYNIAQSYRFAKKHERALFFYKQYLRKVDNPALRPEIEKRIAELQAIVNEGDRTAGAPPSGTLRPSDRATVATAPTRPTEPSSESSRPARTQPEQPAEEPPPTAPAPEPEKPKEKAPSKPVDPKVMRAVGYALIGVAAVGIALGASMTALTLNASDHVSSGARNHTAFGPELQSSDQNASTYEIVQVVGYALAGVAAAGAGVTLYLGMRKPAARAQFVPAVSTNSAGLLLSGQF